MTPKRCVQCGILKVPTEFRKYTYAKDTSNDSEARYRVCKQCEALNMRYKRAMERGDAVEFERINEMYKALEALGYRTPLSKQSREPSPTNDIVEQILAHHGVAVESVVKRDPEYNKVVGNTTITFNTGDGERINLHRITTEPQRPEVPEELQHWLDVPMDEWIAEDISPEFLQETIYESLKAKYRPQTGVDRDLFIPIYDDTYKDVLNDILRRFDDYEEMYSAQEFDASEED